MVYIDHSANRRLARDLERAVKDAKGKSYDEPLNGNEGCGIMFLMVGLACFVIGVVFLPIGLVERSKLPSMHPNDLFMYLNATSTSSSGRPACQLTSITYTNETKRECCGGGNGKESFNVCYENYHLEYKIVGDYVDVGGSSPSNSNQTTIQQYYHQREACRDKTSCDKCPNKLKGKSFLGVEGDTIDCWKLRDDSSVDLSSKEWKTIYKFWNCSRHDNPQCYMPINPLTKYEEPKHTSRVDIIVGATMLGGFAFFMCLGLLCVQL